MKVRLAIAVLAAAALLLRNRAHIERLQQWQDPWEFSFDIFGAPAMDEDDDIFGESESYRSATKFVVSPKTMMQLLELAESNAEIAALLKYIFVKDPQ